MSKLAVVTSDVMFLNIILIYVIFGVSQRRSHQSNYQSNNMFHPTLLFLPEVFPGSTVPPAGWLMILALADM